jgi:hypothetical protein
MSRHPVESPAVLSQLGATGSATTWCGNTMSIAYSQSTAAGMAAASLLMPVPSVCINPLRGIRDGGNRKRQGRGALFDWDNGSESGSGTAIANVTSIYASVSTLKQASHRSDSIKSIRARFVFQTRESKDFQRTSNRKRSQFSDLRRRYSSASWKCYSSSLRSDLPQAHGTHVLALRPFVARLEEHKVGDALRAAGFTYLVSSTHKGNWRRD